MSYTSLPGLHIAPSLLESCPGLQLGLLLTNIRVAERGPALEQAIATACEATALAEDADSIKAWPTVLAARTAYKSLGKDPSRYRPSAEALLRRVVTGKGIYRVNNAVDALNLVSMQTGFSIGGFDAGHIQGSITLQRGGDEPYEAIGRGRLNIGGLPVLYDGQGPFGSPTSDSMRTRVQSSTRTFLWVIFGFGGAGNLAEALDSGAEALQYHAQGSLLAKKLVPG